MILAKDTVRVYPHGRPEQATSGMVILCREQRCIGVAFRSKPPFALDEPLSRRPAGVVWFFAYRYRIGPWLEWFGGGHYEIETAEIIESGQAIHCFRCGLTSHNSHDTTNLYCGHCHRFHEQTAVAKERRQ